MKLNELIADVIQNYKAPSLETLREWELMAIDLVTENAGYELMDAEAERFLVGRVLIDQTVHDAMIETVDSITRFREFLRWNMGADQYIRMIIKFNEWKEKQDGEK